MTARSPVTADARQATSIAIDPKLIDEANALGIDVSQACEDGLSTRIDRARRERQWLAENAGAIASYNDYVDRHGLPLADISDV